jgi:hypothetical protein
MPHFVIDFMLTIKPPPGEQIFLGDVRQLVYELQNHGYFIMGVSTDDYQSADTRQQIERNGVNENQTLAFTDHEIIGGGCIFQAEFVLKARTATRFHGKPEPCIRPAFTRGDIGHLRGGAGGYAKLGGVGAAIRHGAYSFNHNIGSLRAASNDQRLRGPCGGCYSAPSRDFSRKTTISMQAPARTATIEPEEQEAT